MAKRGTKFISIRQQEIDRQVTFFRNHQQVPEKVSEKGLSTRVPEARTPKTFVTHSLTLPALALDTKNAGLAAVRFAS
jgi:hypothetical protein